MSMRVIANFLTVVFLVLLVAPAGAAVMTFKDIQFVGPSNGDYQEAGITASSNMWLGYFDTPGTAHLDDSGTSNAQFISFTMGGRFSAVQFDILPLDIFFCAAGGSGLCNDPYDNVSVRGFRDGALVAEDTFFGGESPNTHVFSSDYVNLDELIIGALLPDLALGGFCLEAPCAHFNIDNVKLNPVPLPAALPLFFGGTWILGLSGMEETADGQRHGVT